MGGTKFRPDIWKTTFCIGYHLRSLNSNSSNLTKSKSHLSQSANMTSFRSTVSCILQPLSKTAQAKGIQKKNWEVPQRQYAISLANLSNLVNSANHQVHRCFPIISSFHLILISCFNFIPPCFNHKLTSLLSTKPGNSL